MSDQVGFTLRDGMELVGVSLDELWWHYIAIGGLSQPSVLADELAGTAPCGPIEHDLIAQALNETFLDRGIDSFPVAYSDARAEGSDQVEPVRPDRTDRSNQARRDAAAARLRSAEAARRAAALQLAAAALMQTSGQLQFARRARARARLALQRGAA